MATEIEAQTVRWIAELVGFPHSRGDRAGCSSAAATWRTSSAFSPREPRRSGWDVRKTGISGSHPRMVMYASSETHTWIQKAADLFGFGTDAIRWIAVDEQQRMKTVRAAAAASTRTARRGDRPFLVVGTAGSVSTGAVDPLPEIAAICREHDLWFHVDGAYGAFAAAVPGAPADLRGAGGGRLGRRRSAQVAVRAARSGLRAGEAASGSAQCVFVSPAVLPLRRRGAELCGLRSAELARIPGAESVACAAADRAARAMWSRSAKTCGCRASCSTCCEKHPEIEALTQNLSIATFRYVPPHLRSKSGTLRWRPR